MGIKSKLWQLKSIAIETDHREPTWGLVLTPWMMFLREVPDTLSLAHPAVHWCHRPQVILEEKVSFGAVGGVIRVINCRGAVKSVLLKTLRRSEYRPAKSGSGGLPVRFGQEYRRMQNPYLYDYGKSYHYRQYMRVFQHCH